MIRSVPDEGGTWRRALDTEHSSLAHSPEWFTVIQRAYGHDPLYLSADDDHGRYGVLPAFVVRRPFFGTVVTSMPFLDSGGPCSTSAAVGRLLVDHLLDEARRIGARLVELRCAERLDLPAQPAEHKVNMTLPLPADVDTLWRRLDGAVRSQVRKAMRSGLTVDFGGRAQLQAFYETFAVRMRDLGSPVHADGFLSAVLDAFGSRARVALVRKGNVTVGGLVAVAFKNRLTVPWAACLQEYFALCPNMLLYWETLREACADGFSQFDFGRSSRDSGTYRFKRQWGAQEERLYWYTILVHASRTAFVGSPHQQHVETMSRSREFAANVWRRLPLAVSRHVGPRIRKYLTQ